jgi:hypothetical protein
MDYDLTLAELADMVAATSEPTLGERELEQLLDRAARPDAAGNAPANVAGLSGWASGTYLVGAVILEGTRYWRVLNPGTTAATEPTWPDLSTMGGAPTGLTVTDGQVTWIDNGTAWSPTWDLTWAAAVGWDRKASKAAADFDFMTGDQQFMRSQRVAACREQARRYRAQIVGSLPISRA